MFGIHLTTWCFPSCQNDTIPLSRTFGWSCPFLCSFSRLFRFFRLSPSIRCSYFAFSRLFYINFVCCARLPGCAMERKERNSWAAGCRSAIVFNSASTSACSASSCASAGLLGSVRSLATSFARSRHRRSSPRAFALQKKSRLPLFSASAL